MIRLLLLCHRYLGIAVGLLMAMWCLSGLVMLYVSYPALAQGTRVAHLAPIAWRDCCRVPPDALADTDPVGRFRIEMLAGRPVLDLGVGPDSAGLVDLSTGALIDQVSAAQAASVAAAYAPAPRLLGRIDYDQWTVAGDFNADRPLYEFRLVDRAGRELYVSGTSGEAVQLTTRSERFWNWLGAVPHWLYFAELRHRPLLWAQIVIYTSLVGCLLAATGLYIGVRQLLHRPAGRWSPYRGFNFWHHMAGLFFGLFTLTWVLSGLLSMNPWGWLQGAGAALERARLAGPALNGEQLRTALRALAAARPAGVVSVQSAALDGRLYLIATRADGTRQRLDAAAAPLPLSPADLSFIIGTLGSAGGGVGGDAGSAASAAPAGASPDLLQRGDRYYFSHDNDTVELPVLRLISHRGAGAGAGTRYYIDPTSGLLLARIDSADQDYRWWHQGLHRLDFAAILRRRPQWDMLMWLLLSGATVVTVTGVYLGYRRLVHGPL